MCASHASVLGSFGQTKSISALIITEYIPSFLNLSYFPVFIQIEPPPPSAHCRRSTTTPFIPN